MSEEHFYHLHSTGIEPCSMTKDAYERARATWLCPGCAAPKPGTAAVDVHIQEKAPSEKPLSFANGCGVPLANREFLLSLGTDVVQRDLYLGKVFGPRGNVLDDWVTFRGRRRVIVRGSKNVSHRQCNVCARHVYFAMGSRYLFPPPGSDASIHESDLFGLVVTPELAARVTVNRWPKLGVEELKVVEKPKDALPELVSE
jgi:hypothetical protein